MAQDTPVEYARLLRLFQDDPQEFRRVMADAQRTTVIPHPGQVPVIESNARFKVLNCGRRWGKTILAAKLAVKRARRHNQMIWWVAPTYKIVKRGYAEILKQLPKGVLAKDPPPDTNFDAGRSVILHFKNGTKMEFYSAERPEGMLGAAVDFAVLDEAAIMPARIWNQIVSPTLIDHADSGALMISTPRGRNWFYQVWLKGQDPQQPKWASWTFTTQDNPTLPPGAADEMAADMPRLEADQEIYAKWLAAGSNVFLLEEGCIERKRVLDSGLVEDQPPLGHVVLGIDLARTSDFTVLYGSRVRDRRNCYFERFQDVSWSEQRRRISRACKRMARAGATGFTLMVDEGNAGSVIVEDLQEAGFDVVGINFSGEWKGRMVRLLANDLERRRTFVLDELVGEFENYELNITPSGRITYSAPEGQHDDVVSAKMLCHWGLVNEGVPEITVMDGSGAVDPSEDTADSDPWDDVDAGDDYGDLLDTDEAVADSIGQVVRDPFNPPAPEELLNRPDLWF